MFRKGTQDRELFPLYSKNISSGVRHSQPSRMCPSIARGAF